MVDADPPERRNASTVTDLNAHRSTRSNFNPPDQSGSGSSRPVAGQVVSFNRRELQQILGIYGKMVAAGEWRDYAIDFTTQKAVFSIYRRTSEVPLYRVEKDPKLAKRQGSYSVITSTGLILKRGHELDRVLSVFDKPLKLIVS